MKVRELRKLLDGATDDVEIVVSSFDHGYREATCGLTTALRAGRGTFTEDYGERLTPASDYGKRVTVLLVD